MPSLVGVSCPDHLSLHEWGGHRLIRNTDGRVDSDRTAHSGLNAGAGCESAAIVEPSDWLHFEND